MKKNNLKIVKIDKNKGLFNYEKKILIKDLILDLKLGYYDFEKEKPQKVKFSLEVNYQDKKPSNDKDLKSIVNYARIVRLIKKLVKNKHYNFLETLAEDVFDILTLEGSVKSRDHVGGTSPDQVKSAAERALLKIQNQLVLLQKSVKKIWTVNFTTVQKIWPLV